MRAGAPTITGTPASTDYRQDLLDLTLKENEEEEERDQDPEDKAKEEEKDRDEQASSPQSTLLPTRPAIRQ